MSEEPVLSARALAVPLSDERVEVAGASVHYLAWGEQGRRGLVFVHGGGAHAHWWSPVAATFAREFRVAALDLSGHGDSDHRDAYALDQWTDEVVAVAADAGMSGPPVVIGHSMGGFVTIATAARHGDEVQAAIVCDYMMDFVARHSLKPVHGGWQWKFDRRVFEQFGAGLGSLAEAYLADVGCRLALLRSEFGLVTPDIGASMFEKLGRVTPVIEIPEAGHHAMLDQPLLLLTALRTLLADWDHSEPHHR
jgi:pimeloyl-ACP methyl ester carboxylesterase